MHRFTGKHLTSRLISDGTRENVPLCAIGCFAGNGLPARMNSNVIYEHIPERSDLLVQFAIRGKFFFVYFFLCAFMNGLLGIEWSIEISIHEYIHNMWIGLFYVVATFFPFSLFLELNLIDVRRNAAPKIVLYYKPLHKNQYGRPPTWRQREEKLARWIEFLHVIDSATNAK